jgi:5'-nucleotidase
MRVLITNDDGVRAPGIRHLARAVSAAGYEVVVAAPRVEASGSSAALTAVAEDGRVVVEKHDLGYGVAASPAYIVVLANLGAFGDPPDLVLSGINRGANAGHAVLHSGTVGAVLTAAASGRSGLAVSLDVLTSAAKAVGSSRREATRAGASSGGAAIAAIDAMDDEARHWSTAADVAVKLLPQLAESPAGTVFNLNVPDVEPDGLAGLRRGSLASFGQVQVAIAESGEGFVRTSVEETGARSEPGTDLALLADGYASVTPIRAVGEDPGLVIDLARADA